MNIINWFKDKTIEEIVVVKSKEIYYLKSIHTKKNTCFSCGKKKETTAHHLFPKRLHCTDPVLKELRVRLCEECHDKAHPENEIYRESEVIKKLLRTIKMLKKSIYWRSMRLNQTNSLLNRMKLKIDELLSLKNEDFYLNEKDSN